MQVLVLDACDGTFGHVGIMLPTRRHFWAPHFSSVSETNRKKGLVFPREEAITQSTTKRVMFFGA